MEIGLSEYGQQLGFLFWFLFQVHDARLEAQSTSQKGLPLAILVPSPSWGGSELIPKLEFLILDRGCCGGLIYNCKSKVGQLQDMLLCYECQYLIFKQKRRRTNKLCKKGLLSDFSFILLPLIFLLIGTKNQKPGKPFLFL